MIFISEHKLKEIITEVTKSVIEEIKTKNRLDEMARIGFMGKKMEYEVYVYTNDPGHIPHVHVRDSATRGQEFDTCIRLDVPDYFIHNYHQGIFNNSEAKAFARFMEQEPINSNVDGANFKTNYEMAVWMWNINNSQHKVKIERDENGNAIIPFYRNLNN